MGKNTLSGISGFFDDLENDQELREGEPVHVQEKSAGDKPHPGDKPKRRAEPRPKSSKTTLAKETRTEPVRLPTGRPPGTIDGEGPRRTKASLWLDADLLDDYRERVYIERRHLGELIEQALREYKQQNW